MEYVLIGFLGIFTSGLSAMVGGGGGLLTAPTMLLVGFSPNTVVATQKAGGIGVNIGAFAKFRKEKDLIQWQLGLILSAMAVVASYIGTSVVFLLDEETIQNIIAIIVVGVVPFMFLSRRTGLKQRDTSKPVKAVGGVLYGVILTVQAAVGSGVGVLNMFVLMGPLGLDALQANATKRLVGLVITTSSALFFISSGYVDWTLAAVIFCSTLFGGYLGAGFAIQKGAAFVKYALMVVSVAMAALLLLD